MKRLLIVSLLFALPPSVSLAELRYSNFEVNWIDVELDDTSIDGDGLELVGSYELNDRLFLFGEWQDQSFDFGIDGTALELGAGLRHELKQNLDFVGTLSYVDTEIEFQGASADDDGLALGGGVRTEFGESFELDAMLKWVDFDNAGSDTGISLGGRYFFTEKLAVSFGTDMGDNVDTLRVGFHADF
jgi:hypothetical protein